MKRASSYRKAALCSLLVATTVALSGCAPVPGYAVPKAVPSPMAPTLAPLAQQTAPTAIPAAAAKSVAVGVTQQPPGSSQAPSVAAAPATIVAPPPPTQESKATGRAQPPKAGEPAFDFELEHLDGGQVSLGDFRGKSVMINFWATWCGPCRFEIPHMVKLYGEMQGQDFEILAVNLREDAGRVRAFASEYDMSFPIVLDPQGKIGAAYFVRGIPTSVFVDREGIIKAVHTGTLTDAALRQYVSDLMQ